MTGKIQLRFLGHQVHVRENRDAHKGLLGDLRTPAGMLPSVIPFAKLEAKPIGKGHKVITGMRGSYGGVLMFGMLTSFAGLGMFNPLSLGAGLVLGRKAYKEDMENRMTRVRNEAKMNVRRFVDDVSFVVNKESRDRLRNIQRQLRDHYRGIANQTTRSLNESLQATLMAAQMEEHERNTRVQELSRQLNILNQVVDNAIKLMPTTAAQI